MKDCFVVMRHEWIEDVTEIYCVFLNEKVAEEFVDKWNKEEADNIRFWVMKSELVE